MRSITELLAEHAPNGVQQLSLRDVGTWYAGGTPAKAVSEFWDNGTIPWLSPKDMDVETVERTGLSVSDAALVRSPLKLVPAGSVAFVVRSNVLRRRFPIAMVPFPTTLNQDMRAVVPQDGILPEYLLHACRSRSKEILAATGRTDGSMAAINSSALLDYRVPVPPIPVQAEVVRVVRRLSELQSDLEAVLEAEQDLRSQQYAVYRQQALDSAYSAPTAQIRDVVDFFNAKAHEKLVDPTGTVALMTARFVSRGEANRFVRPEDVLSPAREGDVALVMSDLPNGRALARTFYVDADDKYAANQRVCLLRSRDPGRLLPRFLHHVMDRNPQLLAYNNGMDQTHLRKDYILDVRIPVPPAQDQERVVAVLDRLVSLAKGLATDLGSEVAARRKQYEYYRDKLLTFEELPA